MLRLVVFRMRTQKGRNTMFMAYMSTTDGETVEINGYTFWSDLPEG